MANPEEQIDSGDLGGGSLADAIAAHLELKKEHGADPAELEAELESALAPANRDEDDSVDLHPAEAEAEPVPSPEPEPEPAPEPAMAAPSIEEPVAEAPVVEEPIAEVPIAEVPIAEEPIAEAPPEPEPEVASKDYAPGEITGTIEFEWDKEEEAAAEAAPATEAAPDHDVLEDVPDFFEETPEHDKLWFDEAPPRKFEF